MQTESRHGGISAPGTRLLQILSEGAAAMAGSEEENASFPHLQAAL